MAGAPRAKKFVGGSGGFRNGTGGRGVGLLSASMTPSGNAASLGWKLAWVTTRLRALISLQTAYFQ
jgi:hypothetical protein